MKVQSSSPLFDLFRQAGEQEPNTPSAALDSLAAVTEAILNSSTESAFVIDASGRLLCCNQTFASQMGREKTALLGEEVFKLLPPEIAGHRRAQVAEVVRTGSPAEFEDVRQSRKIHHRLYPIVSREGSVSAIAIIGTDVTILEQYTRALHSEEERFRRFFNAGLDALMITAPDGSILAANAAACAMFRRTEEEIKRVGRDGLVDTSDPRLNAALEQRSAAGSFHGELSFIRADGERFPGEVSTVLYDNPDGRTLSSMTIRDLSERKLSEPAVRESEKRFRDVFENSPIGIALVESQSGKFIQVNKALCRIVGYTSDEMLTMNFQAITYPEDRSSIDLQRLVGGEIGSYSKEKRYLKKDGTVVWASITVSPFQVGGNTPVVHLAMVQDITEQKTAEQERDRLHAQLIQSQKMESVGRLAGGVAHDFNNILTAMMMQLSLLQQNSTADRGTLELLRELENGANRAAGLTGQLLMFSRRSILSMKSINLNEVVEGLLKLLRRVIGEHIGIEFRPQTALPYVKADSGLLQQVLMNLCVNARDAMPSGGRLTITTRLVRIDPGQTGSRPEARPGLFVCLCVADTGTGMEEGALNHIFEPFYTTRDVGKGRGLGLASVDGIVAQHKGWVEVESRVGEGSTFRVFLPTSSPAHSDQPVASRSEVSGGHEIILLVEDDAMVRRMVSLSLRSVGYRVLEAGSGREALELWGKNGADVDLLFTDMVMPEGTTGLELADTLKAKKPGLKVIVSSGYSSEMVSQSLPPDSGIVFLAKPYLMSTLCAAVRQCIEGRAL
jgi:two-component system, cell cycle sensor histidine kinase and response regulator CckA